MFHAFLASCRSSHDTFSAVYLVDGYNKDMQKAKYAQSKLELTTLRGLTAATEVYYDPDPMNTVIEEDCMWRRIHRLHECQWNPRAKGGRLDTTPFLAVYVLIRFRPHFIGCLKEMGRFGHVSDANLLHPASSGVGQRVL